MTDVRSEIVLWAKKAVTDKAFFDYAEVRPFPLFWPTADKKITNDCSATVTLYFFMANAPDPNGQSCPSIGHAKPYDGYGSTFSLAENGKLVSVTDARPGDLVIYYDGQGFLPGQSVHTALVVEPGADPLTVSHGQQSEPAFVSVSQDGRPCQFFTYDTTSTVPIPTEEDMLLITTAPVATKQCPKGETVVIDGARGGYVIAGADYTDWLVAQGIAKQASSQIPADVFPRLTYIDTV